MEGGKTRDVGLPSVNEHLNYQRKFISPDRVEVTVPTIPFQSFDVFLSGSKVKPWDLLTLLMSVRSFTQWPARNSDRPNDSLVDSHLLMADHSVFIVAMKLEISREFHDIKTPKFPLLIDAHVTHVGNGSIRKRYTTKHASSDTSYITCDIDDVVVSRRNRKPTSLPEWWKNKFSYINKTPKSKFQLPAKTTEQVTRNEVTVEFAHLDHNQHTNFSAYVLFCFNALYRNFMLAPGSYRGVSLKNFHEGVKSLTMIFHAESNFGDELILESWEPHGTIDTVQFVVKKKSGSRCCSINIEFYSPQSHQISKI